MAVPEGHIDWGVIQRVVRWLLRPLVLPQPILSCNIRKLFTVLQPRIKWEESKAWQQPANYALYQRPNWCELRELPYAKPDLHANKTLFEINSVLLVDILPPPMTRSVQFAMVRYLLLG